jgi:hypothetical protein
MKKSIMFFAALLMISSSLIFANHDSTITAKARESFTREFPSAQYVKWNGDGKYARVSFVIHEKSVVAFFNRDGGLLGTARNLLYKEVPLRVVSAFEKRFSEPVVSGVLEINNDNGTSYQMIFKDDGDKHRVIIASDGAIGKLKRLKS